jgi:hypothetical protein
VKAWADLLKEKQKEEVAKSILARGNGDSAHLVKVLKTLLWWKLGKDYTKMVRGTNGKDKGKDELLLLWNECKGREIQDIIVPDEPLKPSIPSVCETELGRVAKQNLDIAIVNASNMEDTTLQGAVDRLVDMCRQRGIIVHGLRSQNVAIEE